MEDAPTSQKARGMLELPRKVRSRRGSCWGRKLVRELTMESDKPQVWEDNIN